jgi:hypothetical protein
MDVEKHGDYDNISNQVRHMIAQRYVALEAILRPYISGDYGDILPGHLNAYITLLKELGRLYEVQKRPRPDSGSIPIAQVEQMLQEAEARMQAAVETAVEATRQEQQRQLEEAKVLDLEAAKSQVIARLQGR